MGGGGVRGAVTEVGMRRSVAASVAAISLALLTACGGGGGGGSTDGGVVTGGVAADFVSATTAPPFNSVSMAKTKLAGNLVTIRVSVSGLLDIYGVAFDLAYDGSKVEYVSWSPGRVLELGGMAPNYAVSSPASGRLVVGASRTGPVNPVDVKGADALIHLVFRVKEKGAFPVEMLDGTLYGPQLPPAPIAGTTWFGGEFRGN